jgi:uncharacterized protein (TIGR02452 family)
MGKRNQYLVDVFEDTKRKSQKMSYDGKTTKHTVTDLIESEGDKPKKFVKSNNIYVVNSDSVSYIQQLDKGGILGRTCILNMASSKKPGGGVANGAMAQEECLFRCSDLVHLIDKDLYPIQNDEIIYTENAKFFKDKDYNDMESITVDVVTVPALNLNQKMVAEYYEKGTGDYERITKDKIRGMLLAASSHGVDNIILGAWGCGVFKNDPTEMAEIFMSVLNDEYRHRFKRVIFAIINDHNSVGDNYDMFKDVIETKTVWY